MKTKFNKNVPANTRQKEFESIKTLYESGKLLLATSEIIKYIEKYPDDMYGHFLCGKLLFKCKRYEEAKKEFEMVYESNGKNKYSGLDFLGQAEEFLGNIKSAKICYKKVIEESPYFEKHAIVHLAKLERKSGNYDAVIELIDKEAPDTREISILLEKVQTLISLNKIDEAWDTLNEIDPNNEMDVREIYLEKANVAKLKEDYAMTKYYLELAKMSGTKNSLYYVAVAELAKINIKMGQYEETLAHCEELIEGGHLFDNDVYLISGTAQQKLKKYQKAIETFKKALIKKDTPAYTTANYYLATLEYALGNHETAEMYLKESIKTDKSVNSSKYVKLLNILIRQQRYEEAQETLNEVISKDDKTSEQRELYVAKLLIAAGLGNKIVINDRNTYIGKQIINYSEEEALEHIEINHITNPKEKSYFNPEIDVKKLYEDIKLQLLPEYIISKGILDDYEIDYPNAGISDGQLSDKITIKTLPGTKNIITMYPSHHDDMPRKIDIMKDIEKAKTKQSDRISKFYQKYGKSTNQTG